MCSIFLLRTRFFSFLFSFFIFPCLRSRQNASSKYFNRGMSSRQSYLCAFPNNEQARNCNVASIVMFLFITFDRMLRRIYIRLSAINVSCVLISPISRHYQSNDDATVKFVVTVAARQFSYRGHDNYAKRKISCTRGCQLPLLMSSPRLISAVCRRTEFASRRSYLNHTSLKRLAESTKAPSTPPRQETFYIFFYLSLHE